MKPTEFSIVKERISQDDEHLLLKFALLQKELLQKKKYLDKTKNKFHENDYLCVTMARLAYEFVKEEYNSLFQEAKTRGLIADDLAVV